MLSTKKYSKQFKIIHSIMKSSDELIQVLRISSIIEKSICLKVDKVVHYLGKVIVYLPIIITTDDRLEIYKNEMIDIFEKVKMSWKDFSSTPNKFYLDWDEFYLMWEVFEKAVSLSKKEVKTFYISLN